MKTRLEFVKNGKTRNDRCRNFRILISFLAASLFLLGCSFAPKYVKPSVAKPTTYKEMEGWKAAEPKDHELREKWWELFNDPELNALEEQVDISNQTIAAAIANFAAAKAVVKQARSFYYPTLTLGPSFTRSKNSANSRSFVPNQANQLPGRTFNLYSLPLEATWEPDLWGNTRNTVRADIYAAQASAATLQNVRLTNQVSLAVLYYELRGQDSLKEILDATVVSYRKTLDLTKVLYTTGINSELDTAQAETQYQTALAQSTALGIQRAQFEHAIALLVGKPASSFSIPARPLKVKLPDIPVGVPSELLERRPDIAIAERTIAQANAQIGVARSAYFPALTLSASGGYESSSAVNLIDASSFVWSVGAAFAQTIFDAGRRKAVTEEAWATYYRIIANYRQTVLSAFENVEDNLAALRILSKQLKEQDAAVTAADKALALSLERYKTGISSYLNVVAAQTSLLNNQQTAMTIRIQQATVTVQLINALGGGWNVSQLPSPGQITKKPRSPQASAAP